LYKTAKILVEEYQAEIPNTEVELVKLPGIGKYTARSVLILSDKVKQLLTRM